MKKEKKVVWMSGGVSSFIAGWLVDTPDTEWIYIHVPDQHEDTMRFIHDCERFLGKKITVLQNDRYSCTAEVARERKFLNSPYGAPCTKAMKVEVRERWEKPFLQEGYELTYVWGMDGSERKRAERMLLKGKYRHLFPLIDRELSKPDCHWLLSLLDIRRPVMYDMGYPNNNCICCLKAGKYTWNLFRRDFPERFAERAALERELGCTCLNGTYLDELDPGSGRKTMGLELDRITPSMSAFCVAAEKGLI